MKKKFFILFTALIFTLNAFGTTFADTKEAKKLNNATKTAPTQTTQLMSALPASDAVMTLDIKRLMTDALPKVLATKPQMVTQINAKIDEIKGKIGIDLREFEQIAAGVSYKKISATETDFDPVIYARGKFNAGAFLGIAKLASKGKYREEKVGDKTIYVFQVTEIAQQNAPQNTNPAQKSIIDRFLDNLSKEIALTNYDNNTLAIGSLARVKESLSSGARVSPELLSLANRKRTAIMSFGANVPAGMSQFINLDIDELGKNLDSIRQLYGTFDFAAGNAVLSATARTTNANEAQSLEEMISGLQMIGKSLLAGSKGADKQIYAGLVEKAVISRKANEVMLDLQIPQADVDALVGVLIK
jgi:hypothetical protein